MTNCQVWDGRKSHGGYGMLYLYGRDHYAHRLAWEIAKGPIPDGLCVLHECDNPPCFNTDHLFLGTRADNNHDKAVKGRARNGSRCRAASASRT